MDMIFCPKANLMMILRFLLFLIFIGATALDAKDLRTHEVVVSIAPYRYFVEKIAGDTLKVNIFVPIGASFHDYEPTPKQVFSASNADLWFRVGESFEGRAMQAMQGHNLHVKFVDLREGVDLITVGPNAGCCHCHANGADLHIWLSPRQAKVQARTIARALSDMYPEHREIYEKHLDVLLNELNTLDIEITKTLSTLKQRVMMVGHPAYAYFARDYNLKQLSIEYEGKDPTPRQLTIILDEARAEHIHTIFTQKQYGSKAVKLVANELKADIVTLDPYSDQYFSMMREIANRIANANSTSH